MCAQMSPLEGCLVSRGSKLVKNLFTHCIVFANLMVSYVKKLLKFRTVIVFVKKPHLLPSPMYCMTGHTLLVELP